MDNDVKESLRKIELQLNAIEESLYALEEMLLELRNFSKPTLDLCVALLDKLSERRVRRSKSPA